jgi:hypothetical protein
MKMLIASAEVKQRVRELMRTGMSEEKAFAQFGFVKRDGYNWVRDNTLTFEQQGGGSPFVVDEDFATANNFIQRDAKTGNVSTDMQPAADAIERIHTTITDRMIRSGRSYAEEYRALRLETAHAAAKKAKAKGAR